MVLSTPSPSPDCFNSNRTNNLTTQTDETIKQAEDVFDMFVDLEGARGEERVDALMRALGRECNSMLVLDRREVEK